jgi:hypothetical protein
VSGKEGAPGVAGGSDEVLQLGRGEGMRDLQEISGIGSSARSSPGSGGRWRCSAGIREGEGLPVAGGGGPGAGSGGEARALERRSRRGVGTGERVEQRERGASGSVAARQMGKRREKVGARAWGGCHAARGAVRLASTGERRLAAARARRSRATCVARARVGRTQRGREAPDGWVAAQCQAAMPLIGGASLSAGVVESAAARGPAREESGLAEPR